MLFDSLFLEGTVDVLISLLIVLCLFLSGFASYCKSTLALVNGENLQNSKYSLSAHGKLLISLLQHPQRLLFVLVTSKFISSAAALVLFLYLILPSCMQGVFTFPILALVALFATTLLFVVNETIPQRLATHEIRQAVKLSRFIPLFSFLSKPIVSMFELFFETRQKLLPNKKQELSIDELSKSMDLTKEEISEGKDLLEGLINFNDKSAVEIMTPREDMACLDVTVSLAEITQYVVEMHYSRIPIYDKTEDNIRGILYVKDLLPVLEKSADYRWQQLIRPAYFVPETKKIDALLKEFRSNKIHLAIVVDEFGGTSGLVTMEDILEEIVGEISDEYDEERKSYVQLSDGSLIFEGKTLLTDFFRAVEADESEFEELTGEVDTLAGLILELKGDFPRRQEVVTFRNYRFQVLEMSKRRIVKVKFTILDTTSEAE